MKTKKPGQWYSSLKRLTSYDQLKNDQPTVDEINHLSDKQQSEIIAEKFATIQNEYEPLKSEDISVPPFEQKDIPQFHPAQVWYLLTKIKTNKAIVSGDFPAKLTKHFAAYLAEPLTDILNTSVRRGEYQHQFQSHIQHRLYHS